MLGRLLGFVAMLGACSVAEPEAPLAVEPGLPIALAGAPGSWSVYSGPTAGESLLVWVQGAPVGASIGMRASSTLGPGRCPQKVLGVCVRPGAPGLQTTAIVDSGGDAWLELPVPYGSEQNTVYLQLAGVLPNGAPVRALVVELVVACPDRDGDGTDDCNDACPDSWDKTDPGICGCWEPDWDSDFDGAADCQDACPYDPSLVWPGPCDCDHSDMDWDGAYDCVDYCPENPAYSYTPPDSCGCDGRGENDSDGDGWYDCEEECPSDPSKTSGGQCGCGTPDEDLDGDGTTDCVDPCPNDPNNWCI